MAVSWSCPRYLPVAILFVPNLNIPVRHQLVLSQDAQPAQFYNYAFFKVEPRWRWLADLAKSESAKELEVVMSSLDIRFRTYSTLGFRDDSDLLFWFVSNSVEEIQNATSKLYLTTLGKYITPSHSYLSCTRPSIYSGGTTRTTASFASNADAKKYAIVYPFTKTREWYLLPLSRRKEMMAEHIHVSQKYPEILLNTTYAFGIHDSDFVLAFETDDIRTFQDLIVDLRETAVSAYVKSDIPMIVCVKKDIIPLVASLG